MKTTSKQRLLSSSDDLELDAFPKSSDDFSEAIDTEPDEGIKTLSTAQLTALKQELEELQQGAKPSIGLLLGHYVAVPAIGILAFVLAAKYFDKFMNLIAGTSAEDLITLYNDARFNSTKSCVDTFPLTPCYSKSFEILSAKNDPCLASSSAVIDACCDLFDSACRSIASSEFWDSFSLFLSAFVALGIGIALWVIYCYEPNKNGLRDKVHGFFNEHPDLAPPRSERACCPKVSGRNGLYAQISSALGKVNNELGAQASSEKGAVDVKASPLEFNL